MAVRVQSQAIISFGTMAVMVTATHVRIQKAGVTPVVKQLDSSVVVAANEVLRIPSGSIDMVYPRGEFTDAHMRAMIDPYWDGETFQIDLMTSSTNVISTSGYSQQTYSNWAISTEAD